MSKLKLCLEDLPNEVLMVIFDYLYGQQIFSSFFNLNHRFHLLCTHYSNYHIDERLCLMNRKELDHFLYSIYSKHIRSLTFNKERRIRRISIEYLFTLCSLTFTKIENPIKIKEFLEKLPSPNQLHYLSIDFFQRQLTSDIQDIITTIFKLPNLYRLDFGEGIMRLDVSTINQPLLSLRHLSIHIYTDINFSELAQVIPNLISLNLLAARYFIHSDYISIQPNSFLKLKRFQMNDVADYRTIDRIHQLYTYVKIFKINCISMSDVPTMINAKEWEQLLSSMKYLQRLEINIDRLPDGKVIDLSQYETEFWTQRNLKPIVYYNQKNNSRSLCIKTN